MSKREQDSDSGSSSSDADGYEHDGFVVPDDFEDPEPSTQPHPKRHKHRRRLRKTKRQEADPEDLELVAASQQIKAKDKDALEHELFKEERPVKRRKEGESDSDDDFIEPEDGEILEGAVDAGKGQVSTALSIFGASAIYTPKEPAPQPPQFEPADIIARFATSEDEGIRVTDLPERMQTAFAQRLHPTEAELEGETDWLLTRLAVQKSPTSFPELKVKVAAFLRFYRVDKFEISYISAYRLHLLSPELTVPDLWEMYRWDMDWAFVYEQKTKLTESLHAAARTAKEQHQGKTAEAGQKVLVTPSIPEDVSRLLAASVPEEFISELSDLTQFMDIFVYTVKDSATGKRVVSRKQMLSDARRGRLDEFAFQAGLTPAQLVDNIKAGKKVHIPKRLTMKPQDLAFEYVSGDYSEEFRVLHTVCMLMKAELAGTPGFRAFIRREYRALMRVVTTPTERGKQVLDVFHPAYRVKHLGHGKALETFDGELWAEVVKAEADGLIKVELKLPWADVKDDRILAKLKPYYLTDEGSDETEGDWNNFRTEVLRHALAEAYEALNTETRKVLMYRAEESILSECRTKYTAMLIQAPFTKAEDPGPVRVFAFVADPSTAKFGQVALAVLDGEGEVLDTALFMALIKGDKEVFQQVDDERHKAEKRNLQQMLLMQKPDVLVVGANCLHAMQLRKILMTSARLMSEGFMESEVDWPVDQSALLQRQPPVVMGDLQVARLYSDSHRGRKAFPDFNPLLRQAVSLGRWLQSPLAETLGLWTDPNEILTSRLRLHRLQKLIPEKQLLLALEEEAIKASSDQGADLNRLFDHPHLRPILSFVAGLGPVKAHGIFERMLRSGPVYLRTELLTRQLVTKLVYQNCAGFVIIRAEDKSDPLDRTRIHPEHYDLAKKIAASALENARDEDESNIEKAMNAPALVKEVDLDNYANYLEGKGRKCMKEVLEMIVREFAQPYYVARPCFKELEDLDLLYNLSGESQLTLRKGLMAQAYVTSNADGKVRCRLESGLDALVIAEGIAAEKLQVGTSIRGRVLEVRVNVRSPEQVFFNVKLSVKQEDLIDHSRFKDDILVLAPLDDAAFVQDDADWTEKSLMEDEHQLGQKYIPRVVSHPKYKNVGLKTACSELEGKETGDFVFRPSSRGTDHLTCTIKFYDFVYCHLDIIEEGKPADNMLGTRFKIADEAYESLQEIVERYIVPVAALTKEAITHHKFKDITGHGIDYLEVMLKAEKKAAPSSIPYYFTITQHYPQFLVLCYLPRERIVKEFVKVKPKGLFFHESYHPNINFLISWFKRHYGDNTYQGQLSRSKAPVITTENRFAIPGKVLAEVQQASLEAPPRTPERPMDTPLRRTPGYGDQTPFGGTPHIGNQEWAGGAALKNTPRADDWLAERNFQSFVPTSDKPQEDWAKPKNIKTQDSMPPPVPAASANSWGATSAPQDTAGGWGAPSAPAQSSGNEGWGPAKTEQSGGNSGWGASASTAPAQASASSWGPPAASNPPASTSSDWGASSSAAAQSSSGGWGDSTAASGGSWGASATTAASGSSWGAGASTGASWGSQASSGGSTERGGRGARRGGRGCFKCGEEGHMSRECTKAGAPGGGGKGCFKCGEEGHMSRECPKGGAGGGGKGCFKCGEEGHMSRECPKGGSGGGGGKGCFKCGEEGHMSRECPKGGAAGGGPKNCFKCGEEGHMSRECPKGGGNACFNCGKEGHMSKDCTEERKPRGRGRGGPRRGGGETHSSGGSSGWGASGATTGGWGGSSTSTEGQSGWGGAAPSSSGQSAWGAPSASAGTDAWGTAPPTSAAGSDPWGASSSSTAAPAPAAQADPWGAAPSQSAAAGSDPWGAPPSTAPAAPSQPVSTTDAWGAPAASSAAPADPWGAPAPTTTSSKPAESTGWGPAEGKANVDENKWQ